MIACSATVGLPGCFIGPLIGGMAANAERSGSHKVAAKYTGLAGKSFAVVVSADRSIQADHPEVVVLMTRNVSRQLEKFAGASGVYPADEVLRFQFQRPGWVSMSPREVAKELGVERLVYVELTEFTLTDPGNAYVWAGVAAGSVAVVEADSNSGADFSFRDPVHVTYPDQEGLSPLQVPEDNVRTILAARLLDRCVWPFYDHDEPNVIEY